MNETVDSDKDPNLEQIPPEYKKAIQKWLRKIDFAYVTEREEKIDRTYSGKYLFDGDEFDCSVSIDSFRTPATGEISSDRIAIEIKAARSNARVIFVINYSEA